MSPHSGNPERKPLGRLLRNGSKDRLARAALILGLWAVLIALLPIIAWSAGDAITQNETLHTAVATFISVACISLSAVVISFVGFDRISAPHYWISLSLLLFGGLILIHSVAGEADVFHALRIYAVTVAALLLLPAFFRDMLPPKKLLPYSIPLGSLAGIGVVVALFAFDPLVDVVTVHHESAAGHVDELSGVARFLDIGAAVIFLGAACKLTWAGGEGRGRNSDFLLSMILAFLSAGMVGHAFTEHWSPAWWGWHAFQIAASVLCFTYIIRLAGDSQRDIRQYLKMLQMEIETRRREQQEAVEARNEAEFANRSKTNFLMGMSHELRTPLNSILGYSEMISMQVLGPLRNKRYRSYADNILVSGQHLLHLIDDLIDVTRAETNVLELDEAPFPLRELCNQALGIVETRAKSEGVAIEADLPTEEISILGDQHRLLQAILNLLINALKFSPEGTSVEFAARLNPDGSLSIIVTDTGPGIPEDQLEEVRLPFVQVRDSSMLAYEGIGLGLAIVSSVTMLHDGAFLLRNRPAPDSGVVAEIHLPKVRVRALAVSG